MRAALALLGFTLGMLLVLGLADAQIVKESDGTHWFPGRVRRGPTKFANLDTDDGGHGDGTDVYCQDCLHTCPASPGAFGCDATSPLTCGSWCVREAGVWNCCRAIAGSCPAGQCQTGVDPVTLAPTCTPCGCTSSGCQPETCPTGQVLTAVTASCLFTCTPLVELCCEAGLSCCPTTTTTTIATTSTTTLLTSTSTTHAPTTSTTSSTTSTTLPFLPSTTFLVVPQYLTSERPYFPTPGYQLMSVEGSQVMYCARFMAPIPGIQNASKLAMIAQTGSGFASVMVGIYPDSDGGTVIGSTRPMTLAGDSVPHVLSDTALHAGPVTLVAFNMYRVCICGNLANQIAYETPTWVPSNGVPLLENKFANTVGIAANSCAAFMPATTGAITPTSSKVTPIVFISAE